MSYIKQLFFNTTNSNNQEKNTENTEKDRINTLKDDSLKLLYQKLDKAPTVEQCENINSCILLLEKLGKLEDDSGIQEYLNLLHKENEAQHKKFVNFCITFNKWSFPYELVSSIWEKYKQSNDILESVINTTTVLNVIEDLEIESQNLFGCSTLNGISFGLLFQLSEIINSNVKDEIKIVYLNAFSMYLLGAKQYTTANVLTFCRDYILSDYDELGKIEAIQNIPDKYRELVNLVVSSQSVDNNLFLKAIGKIILT